MPRFIAATFCVLALSCLAVAGPAETAGTASPAESAAAADSLGLFEAERVGLATVKFIPSDSRSARIVVTNVANRPLTLRLPERFAGVPAVLAQMGGMGGMGMPAMGGQAVGGGAGPQNAGMGIGAPMGGNPFCWVAREVYGSGDPRWLLFRTWLEDRAPAWLRSIYRAHGETFADWIHDRPLAKALVRRCMDVAIAADAPTPAAAHLRLRRESVGHEPFTVAAGRSRTFRVDTVCLQHGRPEPQPRMEYRLVPLEDFSSDPRVAAVIDALARGELGQRVAQAATWHVTDGLGWEQLAAKKIDHAGGYPDEPFFREEELVAAAHAVAYAERIAARAATGRRSESAADSAR